MFECLFSKREIVTYVAWGVPKKTEGEPAFAPAAAMAMPFDS